MSGTEKRDVMRHDVIARDMVKRDVVRRDSVHSLLTTHHSLFSLRGAALLAAAARQHPAKAVRFIIAQARGRRTGSRRGGCFWGGDGARPPGLFRYLLSGACRIAVLVATAVSGSSHAQTYPVKPIRFIIAQAPGGQNDVQARIIGQKLGEALGQPMVYDNRPGAGGRIGFELLAQTPPDGYTLASGSISTLAVIPMMPRKPRYDPLRDFASVTLVSTSPYVVTTHPSVPARTIRQFVALAKARPGAIAYASSGVATGIHLVTELFMMTAGITMVHVPYKGGAPAATDLIAGQVAVMFNNVITAVPHVKAGKLRALAVTTAARSPALPEAPTVAESGYPGYESNSWQGIVTRAGTPQAIVARLNSEAVRALQLPEVRNPIVSQGNDIATGPPEEFLAYILKEMEKWGKVIQAAGVKGE
jgi:tripartite-type tricarboxylate transporter receptor subunit TctC